MARASWDRHGPVLWSSSASLCSSSVSQTLHAEVEVQNDGAIDEHHMRVGDPICLNSGSAQGQKSVFDVPLHEQLIGRETLLGSINIPDSLQHKLY